MPLNRTPIKSSTDATQEEDASANAHKAEQQNAQEAEKESAHDGEEVSQPQILIKPSGKLGAVTRKINEIKELTSTRSEENIAKVKELVKPFHDAAKAFETACKLQLARPDAPEKEKDELEDYYHSNWGAFYKFDDHIKNYIYSLKPPTKSSTDDDLFKQKSSVTKQPDDDNESVGSRRSKSSRASTTTSSIRARLIERKAKERAERVYLREKLELDKVRLKEQQQLEREKLELDQAHQRRLSALDEKKAEYEDKIIEQELDKIEGVDDLDGGLGEDLGGATGTTTHKQPENKILYNKNVHFNLLPDVNNVKFGRIDDKSYFKTKCNDFLSSQKDSGIGKSNSFGISHDNYGSNDDLHAPISNESLLKQLVENQIESSLPKVEPFVFDGSDKTKYKSFLNSFDHCIAKKCLRAYDKWTHLLKYTSGFPHELVESSEQSDPVESYNLAISKLEKQYGDSSVVSAACLEKLKEWKPIGNKDPRGLSKLATFLDKVRNMMAGTHELYHLDAHDRLMTIIHKLPTWLQNRWPGAARTHKKSGKKINFNFLVEFVEGGAEEANMPILSEIKSRVAEEKKPEPPKKKSFQAKTADASNEIPCVMCKMTNHTLDTCIFFLKKPENERYEFVKEKKLCFSCLRDRHSSKFCRNRLQCKHCKRKHPSSLHKFESPSSDPQKTPEETKKPEASAAATPEPEKKEKLESETRPKETSSRATKTQNLATKTASKIVCPAVPMKLETKTGDFIEVYAALDTQSTDSYMNSQLAKKLGLTSERINVNLTTVEHVVNTWLKVAKDVEVLSLDGRERMIIPELFIKDKWSFTAEDSPHKSDLEKCPHLKETQFTFINSKVELLIGMNVPEILSPLDTRSGRLGAPYATKHFIGGWALNGPMELARTSPRNACMRSVARVQEDPDEIVRKLESLYNEDFMDRHGNDKEFSVEDKLWEQKVRNTIRQRKDGH